MNTIERTESSVDRLRELIERVHAEDVPVGIILPPGRLAEMFQEEAQDTAHLYKQALKRDRLMGIPVHPRRIVDSETLEPIGLAVHDRKAWNEIRELEGTLVWHEDGLVVIPPVNFPPMTSSQPFPHE